jgi:D-alanyl-D-alanine carboxypeptidase (penicillin-binding protein 5/6)
MRDDAVQRLMTRWAAALCLLALSCLPQSPALAQQQGFQTTAPFAILMDSETGAVLFERAADDLMVPASMAKLMTAEVLFDQIAKGKISLDDEFTISEGAWRRGGAPSRGSSMFAALNSKVKVSDLILGIAVVSGNDSAIAIAEGVAGTEGAFATRMTARARELGLKKSVFANSTGMGDPEQKVTARELAVLANHIVKTYPELYKAFGQRDFTWNKIPQKNRNNLLTMDIGADGLKTGNIAESGFGVVASAVQNGQRLIVVVNGMKSSKERDDEARRILAWGFRSFETRELFPAGEVIGEAKVFGGDPAVVPLVARGAVRALVPRGSTDRIVARIVYQGPLLPPVAAGQEVGRLKVQRGDVQALDLPLYAQTDAGKGPLTRRAFDAATEFVITTVRSKFTKSGS